MTATALAAQELTEKLISKVQKYVFLYDKRHPEYRNLLTKDKTWKQIAEELNLTSKFVYIFFLFIYFTVIFFFLLFHGVGSVYIFPDSKTQNLWA
jgi:hypothetical protein